MQREPYVHDQPSGREQGARTVGSPAARVTEPPAAHAPVQVPPAAPVPLEVPPVHAAKAPKRSANPSPVRRVLEEVMARSLERIGSAGDRKHRWPSKRRSRTQV